MADKNNIPQFVNSDSFMADKNYVKWLSDLKKRFHIAQLKADVKVNTEMLKFYWSLGEDICEKQKQYKWGANFMKRLSLDLRAEFPQAEGFSWSNLYKIRKWYLFYSSQIEFLYQAGTKLQTVDNVTTPMPDLLQFVPWRHQTVIVSKCTTINAALFYLNKVIEDNITALWSESKAKAITAVNTELLDANWQTGKYIVEYELKGKDRAEYGKQLLVNLAKDLTAINGKGFSRSNLVYMRKFYLAFPICETLSHKLTWSHYFELLKCDNSLEMQFYYKECIKEGWKVRELKRQMKSCLFQRLALSTNKAGVLALANEGHQVQTP